MGHDVMSASVINVNIRAVCLFLLFSTFLNVDRCLQVRQNLLPGNFMFVCFLCIKQCGFPRFILIANCSSPK